jgi:hypothetical protein
VAEPIFTNWVQTPAEPGWVAIFEGTHQGVDWDISFRVVAWVTYFTSVTGQPKHGALIVTSQRVELDHLYRDREYDGDVEIRYQYNGLERI